MSASFRDGIHVTRCARLSCRDFQFRTAHPAAVMDIYLAHTELQLLVLCAGRVLQCVARRRLVEENCVSMLGRGLWKRVGPQNSLHFGSRAHNDTNWLSDIVTQAPFEIGFHSCWRRFAFKNDITTGDVGLDARKPGVAAYDLQFSHWEFGKDRLDIERSPLRQARRSLVRDAALVHIVPSGPA